MPQPAEDYLEARVLAHLGLGADPGPIPAAASGSVRQLLTQLAPAGRGAPPTPLLALDTSPTADPAVRRTAVDRRLASVDASALAAGFLERRRTGDPWWEWGRPFPLTAGTRSWLLRCGGPVEPVDGLLRRWAGAGRDEEVTTPAFRTALREGRHGPAVALPSADALLRILVPRLRRAGLLPPEHRVTLVRKVWTSAVAVPVRVPGRSVLVQSTTPAVPALAHLLHELAHVAEHALRAPDAALESRWRFDPVRSEGWALLLESLATDPEWLATLGLPSPFTEAVRDTAAFTGLLDLQMFRAAVALDDELPPGATPVGALALTVGLNARLGIDRAPQALLQDAADGLRLRSYLAGFAWRDEALGCLTDGWGPRWWAAPAAWKTVRGVLAGDGDARTVLDALASRTAAGAA
ncbi:hypothetical protein JGS39_00380 [Streptomyces sp. P01-B04]|uniref:hypothetical protein n=1 Tax=Streptomyces poriferorum TaxID=2798799 RepID=UPI001C5EC8C5|nr:hypothetical protein [Streptomyces poriferorum]MBW5247495.1 hypothetical protein [Streptomyces poriferorum]MBW5255382.1 hypothetical protein [Streptomyces poriferorum]